MKVNYQNQTNCTALSKRPKSGDKDKYQTIMNNKIQTKYKYASYFQSPNKGEDILFIKKKFQKLKKSSNDKIKNKTTNNTNNNSNNNISSSYISFMSPINKNYYNKKQNNALTKFLKNQLILNSIDNSSFIGSKEKDKEKDNDKDKDNTNNKDKDKVLSYNNSNNLSNMLKSNIHNKNNKVMNNNENISNLNNLKINYNDINQNKAISTKNALSNSNIAINKISSSNFISNKKCTPESSHYNHNRLQSNNNINSNLNEQNNKDININKKQKSKNNAMNNINNNLKSKDTFSSKNEKVKEMKKLTKEKDKDNKMNRKSCRFNFFNNNNFYSKNLYSVKGMMNNNNKKSYKNTSNQNLLSNTVFEYNKSQHNNNNINFFENYVKAVAMNKNNKYSINKSISINKSNIFNNISNKKPNHNITFNSNNISSAHTNRETNQNTIHGNQNKNIFPNSAVHSPKSNISKTTKSSPKTSLINLNSTLNKMSKKLKCHIKNKSISIITKSDASLLYKNNNNKNNSSNIYGSISNHNNYKISYNNNNMNYTSTHANGGSTSSNNNVFGNNPHHQYKYSLNLNKKLKLFDIGNNNLKKGSNSPYNVYFKKKTQPNSNENTFINGNNNYMHKNSNKMNSSKNYSNMNTTGNNSKNKNIYINKNHLPKHKNLSSLNNSTHFYYNNIGNIGQNTGDEIISPNSHHQQYQKTEDIIVNNYNININNQIHNTNTFFAGNIIHVDSKKKSKNKYNSNNNSNNNTYNNYNNNNQNNSSNNNIPYKQSLKKKKIFSQSLKDILVSNKNAKNFTASNSPINKLEILLNTANNNYIKKNNVESKLDNKNKITYKKWSSNRDKSGKEMTKKKIIESISSRKPEETKDSQIKYDNKSIHNNKNIVDSQTQRKSIEYKKKINQEMENNTKKNKNSVKNLSIHDFSNINDDNNIDNIDNIDINDEIILSQYNPTLSSRSSTSYDSNYYMKESLKLSCYISKYFSKYKKYPNTSLQFYKYGRLIGQGAFGKVNLGLNILTGRIVAVKSFNKNNSELTGDNMKKIKYETDLMKKLNHPNITKILEMFEDEKYFLIIMEYINGGNLFSFVKKRRKLSEKTAKFLFRQIILGIKYIHEQNIVHRDIKLENLLIDLNNNVKICDFGIGRKINSKNQLLYDQCGTLMYMAPEILLSTKEKGYEGFPVDIWSSGISLYIMLSGTLPFNYKNKKNGDEEEENEDNEDEDDSISNKSKKNDDDNFELQYSIVYKEPKHIEKISDEARDLLKGLLNKDPKKRLTCDQILNHPWLYNFKEKNTSSNKFHLFTKAEMIMLSKTFIDYRRANADDLKENFSLSNLESENNKKKNNSNEENITSKSSILAPYNSIISEYDSSSRGQKIKSDDLFNDFNNSKIKLEKDQIIFSKKIKEYNRLYELNNNGEVDNGVLINSKTQSSVNMSDRSSRSIKNDILDLNISGSSCVVFNENDEIIQVKKMKDTKKEQNKDKNKDKIKEKNKGKNNDDSQNILNEEMEQKIKTNNILNQMVLMGYDKKYVLDCVKKNELCHASTVYYLMMNYENI